MKHSCPEIPDVFQNLLSTGEVTKDIQMLLIFEYIVKLKDLKQKCFYQLTRDDFNSNSLKYADVS